MDIDQNLVTVHALSICYTIDPYPDVVKLTTVKNSKGGAQLNAAGDSLVNTAMAIDDAKLIVIDCFGFRSMSIIIIGFICVSKSRQKQRKLV